MAEIAPSSGKQPQEDLLPQPSAWGPAEEVAYMLPHALVMHISNLLGGSSLSLLGVTLCTFELWWRSTPILGLGEGRGRHGDRPGRVEVKVSNLHILIARNKLWMENSTLFFFSRLWLGLRFHLPHQEGFFVGSL